MTQTKKGFHALSARFIMQIKISHQIFSSFLPLFQIKDLPLQKKITKQTLFSKAQANFCQKMKKIYYQTRFVKSDHLKSLTTQLYTKWSLDTITFPPQAKIFSRHLFFLLLSQPCSRYGLSQKYQKYKLIKVSYINWRSSQLIDYYFSKK